jgi:hypothetical protein
MTKSVKLNSGPYIEMRERGYRGPPGPHLNHASLFTRTGEVDMANRKALDQPARKRLWEIRENEKRIRANQGKSK